VNNHTVLSFIKSGVRITGYFALIVAFSGNPDVFLAGCILIGSEVLGIVEEIGV